MKNPLDDKSVIDKLILAYSKIPEERDFYHSLMKQSDKENVGVLYPKDSDRFHSLMFNQWKKNVVNMTHQEFITLRNQGILGNDFVNMREYLKTVPDLNTKKEVQDLMYKDQTREMEESFERYIWSSLGWGTGWIHVSSRYVQAKKTDQEPVEHRLYINTESLDTYKFTEILVNKMDEHTLPYYFKFCEHGRKDDTIVIYSSTKYLLKYIEVLNEIKKENPLLVANIYPPPILTGKIDHWIGYGSEPTESSFNDLRAKSIKKSIDKIINEWILKNKKMPVNFYGKQMNFEDFIAVRATEHILAEMQKSFTLKGQNETEEDFLKRKGFTQYDINSGTTWESIYKIMRRHMNYCLSMVCSGQVNEMEDVKFTMRYDKTVYFSGSQLYSVIAGIAHIISSNDPSFASDIHKEIIKGCTEYGFDPDNYSFDLGTKELIVDHEMSFDEEPINYSYLM